MLLVGVLHGLMFSLPGLNSSIAGYLQLCLFGFLWWLLASQPVKRVFWLGLLFGVANFVIGLAWLYISMNRFGGMPGVLAAAAVVLLGTYLGLFGALSLAAARFVSIWSARRNGAGSEAGPLASALILAACWGLGEIARGFALTGFPWLAIGYAQIDTFLSSLAPFTGVYGIGMATALFAGWGAEGLLRIARGTRSNLWQVPVIFTMALGIWALQLVKWAEPAGEPVSVRLLQGNVPQSLKFDRARARQAIADYIAMVRSSKAQLTVLPETAFTQPLSTLPGPVRLDLAKSLKHSGTIVAIGMPMRSTQEQARANPRIGLTNSIASYSPEGEPVNRYDKRHLVPFGEYIPYGFAWFVSLMEIPLGEFGRGSLHQAGLDLDGRRFAFNICYEDLFGEELANHVRQGANVLINVSNIAWFGDSHALPQHLAISRMRALEMARPMLRATNTGVTAGIDHLGNVFARLPTYEQGVLDLSVQPTRGATPFMRMGMLAPLLLAACLLLIGTGVARVDRIRC